MNNGRQSAECKVKYEYPYFVASSAADKQSMLAGSTLFLLTRDPIGLANGFGDENYLDGYSGEIQSINASDHTQVILKKSDMENWHDAILSRCKTHPLEACNYADSCKETPLHRICSRFTMDMEAGYYSTQMLRAYYERAICKIIERILDIDLNLCAVQNSWGETPLHVLIDVVGSVPSPDDDTSAIVERRRGRNHGNGFSLSNLKCSCELKNGANGRLDGQQLRQSTLSSFCEVHSPRMFGAMRLLLNSLVKLSLKEKFARCALLKQSYHGHTVLHTACLHAQNESNGLLVEAIIKALASAGIKANSVQDKNGNVPLLTAIIHNSCISATSALLENDAGGVYTINNNGNNALGAFMDTAELRLRKLEKNSKFDAIKEKENMAYVMNLLAHAYSRGHILHARDKNAFLLHIASTFASSSHRYIMKTLITLYSTQLPKRYKGRTPLSTLLQASPIPPLQIVEEMLLADPSASMLTDERGRLPLHSVLCRVSSSRLCMALVDAAPEALLVRDPVTQFYPFVMAAISRREHDNCRSLSLIYSLLVAAPDCLSKMNM